MGSLTLFSNSHFKTGVLALSAAGLGALISAQFDWNKADPEVRAPSASLIKADSTGIQEVRRLRAQVSDMRGRLDQVEAAAAQGANRISPIGENAASDEEPEGDVDEPSPSAAPAPKRPTPQMAQKFYAQTLRTEPRDGAWASTKERDIQAVMAANYDSQLVSVECGSTLCRTVVDHVDEDKRQPFILRFVADPTFGTSCSFARMEEGASTQIFCARDGETLPRVDPELQE